MDGVSLWRVFVLPICDTGLSYRETVFYPAGCLVEVLFEGVKRGLRYGFRFSLKTCVGGLLLECP